MSDQGVSSLLEALGSTNSSGHAWVAFLESYTPVLYQTARACTPNEDAAADCYLHICERLARNGFRRLRKFNPGGRASFTTWLRVVARNLCFDWHRSQSGRRRPFKSIERLSPLQLEVYNARIVEGNSHQETLYRVQSLFSDVGFSEVSEIEEKLQGSLSSRQQWILGSAHPAEVSVAVAGDEDEPGTLDIADPTPNQEMQVVDLEQQVRLRKGLASLPAQERLLLQLRFEQELTLEEIARLCGFKRPQGVHRILTAVLAKLRHALK